MHVPVHGGQMSLIERVVDAIHAAVETNNVDMIEGLCMVHRSRAPLLMAAVRGNRQDTALHTASRLGHVQVCTILLRHGANPLAGNADNVSPWFHVCFGTEFSSGTLSRHEAMAEIFLKWGPRMITPEVLVMATYSPHKGVGTMVLIAACTLDGRASGPGYRIVTHEAEGKCSMQFGGLHLLDDPSTQCLWPTTHPMPKSQTVQVSMIQAGRLDLLQTPSALALLKFKWHLFGKRAAHIERNFSVLYAAVLSLLLLTSPASHVSPALNTLNAAVELAAGLMTLIVLFVVSCDVWTSVTYLQLSFDKMFQTTAVVRFVGLLITSAAFGCRLAGADLQMFYNMNGTLFPAALAGAQSVQDKTHMLSLTKTLYLLRVLSCLLNWFFIIYFAQLTRKNGPYFIMLVRMLTQDVFRFVVVFISIVIGFWFAFTSLNDWKGVLSSHASDYTEEMTTMWMDASGDFVQGLGSSNETVYESLVQALSSQQFFSGSDYNAFQLFALMIGSTSYEISDEQDPYIQMVMVVFCMLGPILALNLLIAMMADTYASIKEEARAEWAYIRTEYVIYREQFARRVLRVHGTHYTTHQNGAIQALLDENGRALKAGTKTAAAATADLMERTAFTLDHVEPEHFIVTNKRDFPALNHEMLQYMHTKSRENAKVPLENYRALQRMDSNMRAQDRRMIRLEQKFDALADMQNRLMQAVRGNPSRLSDVELDI